MLRLKNYLYNKIMTFKKWYKNLNEQTKSELIDEIMNLAMDLYVYLKCPKCKRKLPNEDFFTSKGCIWCDIKYFRKYLDTKRIV